MERNREGRRGANGSSANVRRPRTSGFKDASEDESQNSRLRSKKEGFGSRKRRNRRISNGESPHFNNINRSQSEERDESFEEATMPASEDDDDLPPPSVRPRSGKLKIHLKTQEDFNSIDTAVVPRRLRTAMVKRYQDSIPPGQDNENQRKISREVAAPDCSTAVLKPARRMKPKNDKVRPEKVPKVSSMPISEQEAEVAETLFDLARMFSNQAANSVSETNSDSNLEMKMGANLILSPLSSVKRFSSPVAATGGSPSSNQNMSALGGIKRKRPHASICKDGEAMGAAELADAEQFADTVAIKAEVCSSPTGELLALAASIAVSPSTSTNVCLPTTQLPQTLNRPKMEEGICHRLDSGNHASVVIESMASVANSSDVRSVMAESDIKAIGGSVTKEITTDVEIENGLLQLPLARSDCPVGSEIDLMAPPKSGDVIESTVDTKDEQEMNLATVPAAENPITGMGRFGQREQTVDFQNFGKGNQLLEKIEHGLCKYQESGKANEQIKETPNQTNFLDGAKYEVAKQPPKGSGKNAKAESRVQRGDRCASTTAPMAVAANNMTSTALPISTGIASWPAGIPSLGYYTPAAAAPWPSRLPLTGASTVDENIKLPYFFLHSRQSWKRSATHVYISHFIDSQQQLRNNPLWAAAFGANAYNLSIPLAPCVMGVSVGSAIGPEVKGTELGTASVNGKGCAMIAMAKEKSSKPYGDGVGRNSLPQEQAQTAQQQLSLFSQAGPGFVLPVTQSASASAIGSDSGAGNVGLSEAMLGRGSSASLSSSSIYVAPSDTVRDLSNRSVASVAAAQAQTLHSFIQHNTFPYSFAHQQFGPLFGGHPSAQQVAQYYGNPFFGPHIVQPPSLQNSQTPSNLTSETSVSQKQQYSQGYSFASSGSPQHLHNAGVSSTEQVAKKDGVTVSGIPTAEMKSIGARIVYGQTSSSMNFPSSLLAAGMPTFPSESQDFGKQASKMHQAQTQMHYQHQAVLKWQQQQQDANTKHSVSSGKNKGSDGLSAVMASQGHTNLRTVGDSIKGLGHYKTVPDNLFVSGQRHKFSISEGKQQLQEHHTQTQRLVTVGVEDGKENIEECSYSSSVSKEDKTSHSKYQLNRPNIARVDLEESPRINASSAPRTAGPHMSVVNACSQGVASTSYTVPGTVKQFYQSSKQRIANYMPPSSSNLASTPAIIDSAMVTFSEKTPPHPSTFCKMSPQHGSPFLGHTLPTPIQGVRQGATLRQQENISQLSSAGSPRPDMSDSPIQATHLNMARTQGQAPSTHHSAANIGPISRISPSISSPGSTLLSPLSPASKAGAAATPKNASSLKDSLSPKPSSGSSSGKKALTSFQTNGTSVLGSNCLTHNVPVKSSQAQLIQNQYNIHQQTGQYPFFQQTVQSIESVQQQQPLATQQYQLNSNQHQAVRLQKQSLTQQPQPQFRQHLFLQPNPQYFSTQAHQHSESPSQAQAIAHSQNATKQKKLSGQIASSTQQLGNVSQQQVLAAPPASFGVATNATLPAALCLGTSGNTPRTVISDGVLAPQGTKLNTDINVPSSCIRKGNSTGPTFLLSQCGPSNSVPSTQQQVSNSFTISSPYPNVLSQSISLTDTSQKAGEDANER